jgi:hypothetical protein
MLPANPAAAKGTCAHRLCVSVIKAGSYAAEVELGIRQWGILNDGEASHGILVLLNAVKPSRFFARDQNDGSVQPPYHHQKFYRIEH